MFDKASIRNGRCQVYDKAMKLCGGMDQEPVTKKEEEEKKEEYKTNDGKRESMIDKYEKELKILLLLCGDIMRREELVEELESSNGNVQSIIEKMVSRLMESDDYVQIEMQRESKIKMQLQAEMQIQMELEMELRRKTEMGMGMGIEMEMEKQKQKQRELEMIMPKRLKSTKSKPNNDRAGLYKEEEKTQIGELKSGINLQGLCRNEDCLAAKARLPVWINLGFDTI
ncbi:hypothetical protein RFI_06658, partial [Reticulomyxa filosa]